MREFVKFQYVHSLRYVLDKRTELLSILSFIYNIYGKVNVIEICKLYFVKVMNTATMMLTLYFYLNLIVKLYRVRYDKDDSN